MSWRARSMRVWILLAVVLASIFFAIPGHAQQSPDALTIAVSPQIVDVTANPGDTLTNTFRLTNAGLEEISIVAIPKNFTPRGEEGAVDLTEDRTSFSLAEWITVIPENAPIAAGKTQDFVVTIQVPANAEPGSHFGSVVFQTVPKNQSGTGAAVSQEIAPVILVKVAGDVRETAEIESFTAENDVYSNESEIAIISRVRNTGTAHFKPTGQIVVKNMFGREVAKLDLDKKNVLPDSVRSITTLWQKDGFRVGKYTAELTLVYGENDEIRTASTSFIIFPYQIILPIVFGIVILAFILFKGRRRIVEAAKVLSGKDSTTK